MQEDHHFCRWHLPDGFSADSALAAAFPGASRAQAAQQLDTCSPKELREVFATIFGATTTSNNTSWIRQKLKGALGLGGKKPRASGNTGSRKRSAGPTEGSARRTKLSRAASPDSPPTASQWAGFAAPAGRSPTLGRSPSSDWDRFSPEEWDTEDQTAASSAAVAGAATLLAAAAEVESREAAAAAAAATGAGKGRRGSAQRGASLIGGSGAEVGRSQAKGIAGQLDPESPGGSATGSSLSPPPIDASQQVQAFLQGFLRVAQATGASIPAGTATPVAGMQPAAAAAAGRAQGPLQGPVLPSFLTPQTAGQQTAVYRLLAALAAAPNSTPL